MSYKQCKGAILCINRLCPVLLLLLLLLPPILTSAYSIQSTGSDNSVDHNQNTATQLLSAHNFSPRLDNNNAWRPVGRGDPLKNDPTYDYSPPTLDRVRYWAETNSTNTDNKEKDLKHDMAAETYAVAERLGALGLTRKIAANMLQKNAKGEVPLLQPKYLAMRRSYYAPQLSTHLMPPPMQTIPPPQKQYQHNMMNYLTDTTMTHMKSSSTAAWLQNMRTPATPFDSHSQESVNHMQFVRPSHYYSANSIRPNVVNALKQTTAPRKPWLHELLQKEIVKTHRTEMPRPQNIGISTTHRPVATQMPTTIAPPIITIPSSTRTTTTTTTTHSTTTKMKENDNSPIFTPTYNTITMPQEGKVAETTTLPISTRFIIPDMNNLAFRPTVSPMKMTTDSLFKNYNQDDLPLTGPMYLIIEGHSKVKTYGKDELDPHKPKIVPIIPKREPIVRIADPNERRGTIETYQVKHLHTISTTPIPPTTTATSTTTKTTTTTTSKPIVTTTTTTKPIIEEKLSTPSATTLEISDLPANNLTLAAGTPPSAAQGLLNFLDSFFGKDEPAVTELTTAKQLKTTTTENSLRGVRQTDDYKQLMESRLSVDEEDADDNENDDDDADELGFVEENQTTELNKAESIDTELEEEEGETAEVKGENILKRIDNLLDSAEDKEAQDELEEFLSMEDESETFGLSRQA